MVHEMKLNTAPFEAILFGKKDIEMRLCDEKRRLLCVGDEICFWERGGARKLYVEVVALHRFPDFEALYAAFSPERLGYADEKIASASPADMEHYYSRDEQKTFGVLGIEIRKKA